MRGTEIVSTDSRQRYREKIARITLDSMVQFVGLLDAEGTVLEINKVALDAAEVAEVVAKVIEMASPLLVQRHQTLKPTWRTNTTLSSGSFYDGALAKGFEQVSALAPGGPGQSAVPLREERL